MGSQLLIVIHGDKDVVGVPTGRNVVAMGASPWKRRNRDVRSPNGAKGNDVPVVPSGLKAILWALGSWAHAHGYIIPPRCGSERLMGTPHIKRKVKRNVDGQSLWVPVDPNEYDLNSIRNDLAKLADIRV